MILDECTEETEGGKLSIVRAQFINFMILIINLKEWSEERK